MSRVVLVFLSLSLLSVGVFGGVYATSTLLTGSVPKVNNPDFTISASPLSLSIARGSQGTIAIALSSLNGFAGSVNVTAILSPNVPGATIMVEPDSVSLLTGSGSVKITVTTLDSLLIGTYVLNITAVNRQLSHSVTASLVVGDFSLEARESSVAMAAGSLSNTTLTLTSINGFSGNVTLRAILTHGGGAGPKASLSVNTVTLGPSDSQSIVLSLSAPNNPKGQTYTVTILAISGPLTQTVPINVTVQDSIILKQTPHSSTLNANP